ncbi:hypothetical protein BN1058_01153 [Paraliobacillus sp. PM-2]|uniref:hypothetical protein n=1 Tax=Paraliobacillus sp. PM-2 TaxID=1462524 RepID=UPI00061BFEC5|nr:hypothetical protein [Paraliobacillus sp. PM-2]CQR46870.1 hypothetical protein BN1058_01153 [Paraliobacillus sp. PM-2]
MSDEKNSIIIKEIQSWKSNHLLPEKYCNFLLALYTQGDADHIKADNASMMDAPKIRLLHVLIITVNIFILPITFIVLYSTHFKINLQVSIGILMILLSFGIYCVVRKKLQLSESFSFFILLLTVLIVSIGVLQQLIKQQDLISVVAMTQLFAWVLLGVRKKSILLISVGFVGCIFSLIIYSF